MRQFVTFVVADHSYGIDIFSVREIRVWTGATPLPNSPPALRGVINLRGTIIPVVDLRILFHGSPADTDNGRVIVIVSLNGGSKGLLVDSVTDITAAGRNDISPLPATEGGERGQTFLGLITSQEQLIAIINLDQLSADHDTSGPAQHAAA